MYTASIRVQYKPSQPQRSFTHICHHMYTQKQITTNSDVDIISITLFGSGVGFHVLVERGSMDKGFFALSALELLHTSVGRNVGRQVRVYRECFS